MKGATKQRVSSVSMTAPDQVANGHGRGQKGSSLVEAKAVLDLIKSRKIDIVDLKFIDVPGMWQHFTVPAKEVLSALSGASAKSVGFGFDGSSIRGFQKIEESDMMLRPDFGTAFVDPFSSVPMLSVICDVYEPLSGQPYSRDPRFIARKAEAYLKASGVATTSYWGPEAEFFVFDDVRYSQNEREGYYRVDSDEGIWNSGREEGGRNTGYKIRYKEGYFPVPPSDTLQDLRTEMMMTMIACGVDIEMHHHEVATAGQGELDIRFDTLQAMADKLMVYKYVVKNVARKHGKVATFMPKPIFGDNGSGMHVHQSLWKHDQNLFFDAKGYALLSQTAKWYIGGLLKHGHALMALCAPTTNSYKRLVPGYEAPVNLVYSQRNRSAAVRIPMYSANPKSKRIEFRPPDPTCNPYLAFAAMLMAGLDGIENQIDPGQPIDKNIFDDLTPAERARIKTVPGSLEEALRALEQDHQFLLKGGVFTQDMLDTWITYKWQKEVDPIRLRPHPYEFHQYFDI